MAEEHSRDRVPVKPGSDRSPIAANGGSAACGIKPLPIDFVPAQYERTIGRCFEAVVRAQPESTAVRSDDREVSYRELNAEANQIAHCLCASAGPLGENVALLGAFGVDSIAAVIGAFKSGRPCVPLDAGYPQTLLAAMIADAAVGAILCDAESRDRAESLAENRMPVVVVGAHTAEFPSRNPDLDLAPDSIACLLYSSGSTGTPKGIIQNHRNLLRNAIGHINACRYNPDDRMTQFAAAGTGQGMVTVLSGILSGATLCPLDVRRQGIAGLTEWVQRTKISVMTSAASLFRSWTSTFSGEESFPSLRLVRLGSETVQKSDYLRFDKSFANSCGLVVAYSAAECGHIAFCALERGGALVGDTVPVGFEAGGIEVQIWDSAGNPLPNGEVGEIVVRGAYITPGYWNRPSLTSEAIPERTVMGAVKCYRTGDLGRRDARGFLEHLGRAGLRGTVRGATVDLREVENALSVHPAVREALAGVRPDSAGNDRLIAWVVPERGQVPGVSELRSALVAELPPNAVPSEFVFAVSFPLTSAGKVDRQAVLRGAVELLPQPEAAGRAPNNATERFLSRIWKELLGQRPSGMEQSFFDHGGDSLKANQLLARVYQAFGKSVPLHWFLLNPSLAALAERLGDSPPRAAVAARPACRAPDREPTAPLSFGQRRQWFLHQLEPSSAAYNNGRAFRLSGDLDVEALRRSLDRIVERHGTLRSTFEMHGAEPIQRVHPAAPAQVRIVDLAHGGAVIREGQLEALLREDVREPFDLERGPLYRFTLIRIDDGRWILSVTFHHIISDRWSRWIFERELGELYAAVVEGRHPVLPTLAVQYLDYAREERALISGDRRDRLLAYWREQLAPPRSTTDLATDRPRPKQLSGRGALCPFEFDRDLTASLTAIASQNRTTLYTVMLALFKALLFRYSGTKDVIVGSTNAIRTRLEHEPLIGFFVNSLVMRTHADGELSFRQFLELVSETVLGAFEHQETPFELLVEDLQPVRDTARNPLFQILFNFGNTPWGELELKGVATDAIAIDRAAAMLDLTLSMEESDGVLRGALEYSSDLFDAETANRMLQHYRELARSAVADPHQSLAAMRMISDEELHTVLAWGSGTVLPSVSRESNRLFPPLFARQVHRSPNATALIFQGVPMSYLELGQSADRIARSLIAMGAGPNEVVGLCAERSPDMLAGLLGILGAGAAYLPLDPSYPSARLQYMLEDSAATLLVADELALEKLPRWTGATLRLDAPHGVVPPDPGSRIRPTPSPDDLAYVIYTSGSTGKPKGVEISHGAMANFLHSMAHDRPGLGEQERLLAISPISFDISVLELLLPLTVGATVVLCTSEERRDAARLATLIEEQDITLMQATPSTWRLFMALGWAGEPKLRGLSGGEPLPADLALWLSARVGPVWNLYGPTETTIWSTVDEVEPGKTPSLGRPIANTEVFVLDARRYPVPVGAPGELCIGGLGLAAGYRGRPAMTEERFVSVMLPGRDRETRLYATGDRARFTSTGSLEFLGRIDDQVKVRGVRVELGEIEAVLGEHPAIRACVVSARVATSGENRLVAYVVAGELPDDLDDFLKKRLPETMMPTAFVQLAELPLTLAGKLDRAALPEPTVEPDTQQTLSSVERSLADIWREVLGVESVVPSSNFFELGGHSLAAIRIVRLIKEGMGADVPLLAVFDAPTLEQQAAVLAGLLPAPLEDPQAPGDSDDVS